MERSKMFKQVTLAAMALLAALALAACGSSSDTTSGSTAAAATTTATTGGGSSSEGKTLGLLMDVPKNDKSFGTATYLGASMAAKKLGLKLTVVDNLAAKGQEAQTALENFAKDDDFVIDGASATYGALPRIASQFPDTEFGVYAVPVTGGSNLHYAYQDWYPLGYLAGIVAAMTTKAGTVGFVGGGNIPPTVAGLAGYKAGIKATDPKVKALNTITGSFTDPVKAKSATSAQIASGADVVYSFLDAAHAGAVQAAKPDNVGLMGVILPKCSASQGLEIGDTLASQVQLVNNMVTGMADGTIKNTAYALQSPDVASFQFCPGKGTPEIKAALKKATAQFNSGALKSPAP